jgi:hypothetical protein
MDLSNHDSNIRRVTALGAKVPIKIDVSGGDVNVTVPIKAISAVGGTTIMVTMVAGGVTLANVPLPAPGTLRIMNVTKIEQASTDASGILVWPDDDSIA